MTRSDAKYASSTTRRSLVLTIALAAAAILAAATPAAAQIAGALGKPLPSPDLPVGTVSVRIVAGSASSPVVGTDVTLLVNETPRVARTDSAGRASFPGLPAGATVIAKVLDQDKAPHMSDAFTVPQSGGVRVMITTKPWQGGAGGAAPSAGGAGGGGGPGMPNPRQMSGEPRTDQSDPPGRLTVRVTYDDFQDTPEGVPVVLVGYSADDSASYEVKKTDKAGRVQFGDLDRSGGTSYFAMALLPRNGGTDRVVSSPILLESQAGVRMLLSGEKRNATAPPVDDLTKVDPQLPTPAGKIRAVLEGYADTTAKVTLVDAATKKVLAEAAPQPLPPDPTQMRSGSRFMTDSSFPAGTLDILLAGGPGQAEQPLKNMEIRVVPATSKDSTNGVKSVTGASGLTRVTVQASEPQKVIALVNGVEVASEAFDITKQGGRLLLEVQWDDTARLQALLDAPAAGQVVYAECAFKGQHFRSIPVMPIEAAGSKVSIYVSRRIYFQFRLEADVEDELLAVRGLFEIKNYSWAPYRSGPDGLVVGLPRGFKGAVVAESDQSEVSVAPGEGFRIVRPIPPGRRQFHAGFSLPVERGTASWKYDLPLGTDDSFLAVKQLPGMTIHTPAGTQSETRKTPQGPYSVLDGISIEPKQAMVMSIAGLPSQPLWRSLVPGIVGLLVIAMLISGIVLAVLARRPAEAASGAGEAHRQRLIDELVELERSGANPRRREQLLTELEQLWG